MLLLKVVIVIIMVFATLALVYQIAKRIKVKPTLPGNAFWIFYLIEKMFGENDSCSKGGEKE